jgi:hypothetical protein
MHEHEPIIPNPKDDNIDRAVVFYLEREHRTEPPQHKILGYLENQEKYNEQFAIQQDMLEFLSDNGSPVAESFLRYGGTGEMVTTALNARGACGLDDDEFFMPDEKTRHKAIVESTLVSITLLAQYAQQEKRLLREDITPPERYETYTIKGGDGEETLEMYDKVDGLSEEIGGLQLDILAHWALPEEEKSRLLAMIEHFVQTPGMNFGDLELEQRLRNDDNRREHQKRFEKMADELLAKTGVMAFSNHDDFDALREDLAAYCSISTIMDVRKNSDRIVFALTGISPARIADRLLICAERMGFSDKIVLYLLNAPFEDGK